ncbi:MAG: TIGR01777 family protein [Planctomycetes bacterium RBG_16_55_9]|nr:MAG: TIGR01777 family protein [Planctomycetes bacterium RBG_16_55_9]
MRVVITGATGFIGRALCKALHGDYEIIALSRDASRAAGSVGHWAKVVEWDGRTTGNWLKQADGALAIINLAGENIASGRWNALKKAGILHSRLDTARAVIDAIKQVSVKPTAVIQASAIGYYGSRGDAQLNETSTPGKGFFPTLCQRVESYAEKIENLGVRCAVIRTGVVLGRNGGALARLAQPFRFFLGGYLGSGKQWFSWISLEDEVAAIRFLMEHEQLKGAFNLTAPQPVTMKEFCKTLGKVLHRPAWVRVPAFALRLALGEMADEMLLSGQRVLPRRLLDAGFEFRYPDVEKTLQAIIYHEGTK